MPLKLLLYKIPTSYERYSGWNDCMYVLWTTTLWIPERRVLKAIRKKVKLYKRVKEKGKVVSRILTCMYLGCHEVKDDALFTYLDDLYLYYPIFKRLWNIYDNLFGIYSIPKMCRLWWYGYDDTCKCQMFTSLVWWFRITRHCSVEKPDQSCQEHLHI